MKTKTYEVEVLVFTTATDEDNAVDVVREAMNRTGLQFVIPDESAREMEEIRA